MHDKRKHAMIGGLIILGAVLLSIPIITKIIVPIFAENEGGMMDPMTGSMLSGPCGGANQPPCPQPGGTPPPGGSFQPGPCGGDNQPPCPQPGGQQPSGQFQSGPCGGENQPPCPQPGGQQSGPCGGPGQPACSGTNMSGQQGSMWCGGPNLPPCPSGQSSWCGGPNLPPCPQSTGQGQQGPCGGQGQPACQTNSQQTYCGGPGQPACQMNNQQPMQNGGRWENGKWIEGNNNQQPNNDWQKQDQNRQPMNNQQPPCEPGKPCAQPNQPWMNNQQPNQPWNNQQQNPQDDSWRKNMEFSGNEMSEPQMYCNPANDIRDINELKKQAARVLKLKNLTDPEDKASIQTVVNATTKVLADLKATTSNDDACSVLEDYRNENETPWDTIQYIRSKLEFATNYKRMNTEIAKIEKSLSKYKSLNAGMMDKIKGDLSKFKANLIEGKAKYDAKDYEDLFEYMDFGQGGGPGDMMCVLDASSQIAKNIKYIRDVDVRSSLDDVLGTIIDSAKEGEYRLACQGFNEIRKQLEPLMKNAMKVKNVDAKTEASIKKLQSTINSKLNISTTSD